jgi:hypothetical protein
MEKWEMFFLSLVKCRSLVINIRILVKSAVLK